MKSDCKIYHNFDFNTLGGKMVFCSFDIRQANSGTAETPVEFQSEWKNVYTDLAPSSLKDILVRYLMRYWNSLLALDWFSK